MDAFAARFVKSIKDERLSRMIFFSKRQLRTTVSEYVDHYHMARNHQGLENRLIARPAGTADSAGKVDRESRLGGLLNNYRLAA